jgi:hypothetical protein
VDRQLCLEQSLLLHSVSALNLSAAGNLLSACFLSLPQLGPTCGPVASTQPRPRQFAVRTCTAGAHDHRSTTDRTYPRT